MSTPGKKISVMVLGVRGIPNVQGGIETHAEHLYSRITDLGCDVEVIVRAPFVPREAKHFGAVRLTRLWSPTRPGLEALLHSLLGALYAGIKRPDILHIHGIGPSIVTPLARLLGLRVVMTHHGPDYDRDKWGGFARWVLRVGERFGVKCANVRIAISAVIANLIAAKYHETSELIPNGVVPIGIARETEHVAKFGLEPERYFLQVSRIVPEKRHLDLIRAFAQLRGQGWKLALVGGLADDSYSREVESAARDAGVVLTGFQNGAALQQLYSHAGAFVLPSSHEGLPIALLEALSYGLPSLASDIPANLEVGLPRSSYFAMGDVSKLANALQTVCAEPRHAQARLDRINWVTEKYDWARIATATVVAYRKALREQ